MTKPVQTIDVLLAARSFRALSPWPSMENWKLFLMLAATLPPPKFSVLFPPPP